MVKTHVGRSFSGSFGARLLFSDRKSARERGWKAFMLPSTPNGAALPEV